MPGPFFKIKINVKAIAKQHLYHAKSGKVYLDLAAWQKDSEYSDGYLTQEIPKEARDSGERGEIVGNFELGTELQQERQQTVELGYCKNCNCPDCRAKANSAEPPNDDPDDGIPF